MESKIRQSHQITGGTTLGLSHGGLGTAFLAFATTETSLKTPGPCYSIFGRRTHCPLTSDTIGPSLRGRGTEDSPVCWGRKGHWEPEAGETLSSSAQAA